MKITGLLLVTFTALIGLSVLLFLQQNNQAESERNSASRKAHQIALQGTLDAKQRALEKVALALLNTDELLTYIQDRQDAAAKMVLEGLFLSFQEENIVRFSLYSPNGGLLLTQAKNLPPRQTQLPEELNAVFKAAEDDFRFHFYFRGSEGSDTAFPVEYCLVSVVTDDDDNTVGFAEFALSAKTWVDGVAELTENTVSLFDPANRVITLTTQTDFQETLAAVDLPADNKDTFLLHKAKSEWFLTDVIPVLGATDTPVALLLLSHNASQSVRDKRKTLFFVVGLSITIMFIALGFAYMIICRGVLSSIDKVIDFSRALAAGEFTESLMIKSKDEIGEMGAALNNMAQQIRRRAREAEAISTGDLTIAIEVASPGDVLGSSLKKIVNNLGEIISLVREDAELLQQGSREVQRFAADIETSSDTIANRSSIIAEVSVGIAGEVERLAAATEELSASVQEISETTARSKSISTEANSLSLKASETINSLDASAAKIETASVAISDFADQTDLLALNATIEAARAGEAGKGFAVVAAEVKELATQSITTAHSISSDVDEIQQHTKSAVQQTSDVAGAITLLEESSLVVASALTQQASVADDLATTISITFSQIKSFTENVADINGSIQQNNDVIARLSGSAQEMSELANRLQALVGRFSLN